MELGLLHQPDTCHKGSDELLRLLATQVVSQVDWGDQDPIATSQLRTTQNLRLCKRARTRPTKSP